MAKTIGTQVKVRCSDRDGCGWSGERAEKSATSRRCPVCGVYSVEVVGRTPDPTAELFALARARIAAREARP